MARPKKDGTYLNVCIKTEVYNQLAKYCEETGQPKTVAVERILSSFFNKQNKETDTQDEQFTIFDILIKKNPKGSFLLGWK